MRMFALGLALLLASGAQAQESQTPPLEVAVTQVKDCYARGDVEAGLAIVQSQPDLYAQEECGRVAKVTCAYESRDGQMGLLITVRRLPEVQGAFAVAFPPGSLGSPARGPRFSRSDDGDDDPDNQELLLLRAPVVALSATTTATQVWVPAVCANHDLPGPQEQQPYFMTYVKPGSKADRIAAQLCSGAAAPSSSQLAVWVARDDLGRESCEDASTAQEVGRIFEAAGCDTSTLSFFRR
jgi:hypothetical protein